MVHRAVDIERCGIEDRSSAQVIGPLCTDGDLRRCRSAGMLEYSRSGRIGVRRIHGQHAIRIQNNGVARIPGIILRMHPAYPVFTGDRRSLRDRRRAGRSSNHWKTPKRRDSIKLRPARRAGCGPNQLVLAGSTNGSGGVGSVRLHSSSKYQPTRRSRKLSRLRYSFSRGVW